MRKFYRLTGELQKISEESRLSKQRLLLSFLICRFLHGASLGEFRVLEMYRYTNAERKHIYTFQRQKKISDVLNKDATKSEQHMLMEKNLFNKMFSTFVNREWYDPTTEGEDKLKCFLEHNERFLIKPTLSSQGKGIELRCSSEVCVNDFYKEIKSERVILEGFIQQHRDMNKINSTSVNTVRLVTARIGKHIHIVGGGLRVGGKGAFVDNFHNGGYTYPIDIENGIVVGKGHAVERRTGVVRHPSSGVIMCGFQIPNWYKVLDTVKEAALTMERVGYIAWDIAILERGCEIIEANINYPSTDLMQLNDFSVFDSIKKFLQQYKDEMV